VCRLSVVNKLVAELLGEITVRYDLMHKDESHVWFPDVCDGNQQQLTFRICRFTSEVEIDAKERLLHNWRSGDVLQSHRVNKVRGLR